MPTISLYGGPLKRVIVQQAFGLCGQSTAEFELTPEEYVQALDMLNAILAELRDQWGLDLGYNFPDYGSGAPDDESGVPVGAVRHLSRLLAEDVAPTIGKELSTRISAQQARASLVSLYGTIPVRQLTRNTPRGAGNERFGWLDPFFRAFPGDA